MNAVQHELVLSLKMFLSVYISRHLRFVWLMHEIVTLLCLNYETNRKINENLTSPTQTFLRLRFGLVNLLRRISFYRKLSVDNLRLRMKENSRARVRIVDLQYFDVRHFHRF